MSGVHRLDFSLFRTTVLSYQLLNHFLNENYIKTKLNFRVFLTFLESPQQVGLLFHSFQS
jgi:hypothetical protein